MVANIREFSVDVVFIYIENMNTLLGSLDTLQGLRSRCSSVTFTLQVLFFLGFFLDGEIVCFCNHFIHQMLLVSHNGFQEDLAPVLVITTMF